MLRLRRSTGWRPRSEVGDGMVDLDRLDREPLICSGAPPAGLEPAA